MSFNRFKLEDKCEREQKPLNKGQTQYNFTDMHQDTR